jgi:hypothetical protein
MSLSVQVSVKRSDGTQLDMPAIFEDNEVTLLDQYLASVDDLLQLEIARAGVPSSFEMKIDNGQITYMKSDVPPGSDVAALLHRLRPLILTDEPANYLRVASLLGKRFEYPYLRQVLKEQRHLFDGRDNQQLVRITSNGTLINCEQTLFDWLYGYEYHRDPSKRAKIASLHRLMPLEHSIPVFLDLLADKVQAIVQMASMISVILGHEQSVQVRTAASLHSHS